MCEISITVRSKNIAMIDCHLRKLDYFCLNKLKSLCGKWYNEHCSYEEIGRLTGFEWPSIRIKFDRAMQFGNKLRHKQIPEISAALRRPRGRPPINMRGLIEKDIQSKSMELEKMAEDRDRWQQVAKQLLFRY